MRYGTVLFDADDTLLDFKLAEHCAITGVFESVGLPTDDEVISIYSEINLSLWKLLEQGGITKDELKTERFRLFCEKLGYSVPAELLAEKYMHELSKQSYIIKDADKVCKKIYNSGIRMCIVTNGIKAIQTGRFENCPIKKYFSDVFISEDVGYEKPNVKFFNKVFSTLGVTNKKDIILIGFRSFV